MGAAWGAQIVLIGALPVEVYCHLYLVHLEGHVPNFDMTPVSFQWHPRHGRECLVPRVSGTASSSIQSSLLFSAYEGFKYLNSLLWSVKNITGCNVETFKAGLDKYLKWVPDEPLILGYTRYRGSSSNLLLDRPRGSVL